MLPFRELLKPGAKFTWNDSLNKLFEESKRAIVSETEEGIRIFDPLKPTCLATDWAKTGLGFWLFQKHCNCQSNKPFCCHDGWRITSIGSRFSHPVESRYAPIEGEALAVIYSLNSTCFFVLGWENLTVAVNHKLLLKVFQDRALEDIDNSCLCNLKETTLTYHFRILHVSGVKEKAADATSRHSVTREPTRMLLNDDIASTTDTIDMPTPSECHQTLLTAIWTTESTPTTVIETFVHHYMTTAVESLKSVTWDRVWLATNSDEDMATILSLIKSGMAEFHHQLPPWLQEYHLSSKNTYLQSMASSSTRISEKGHLTCPPFSTQQHHLHDLPC